MFRPCIDLHDGKVKQIVGGTLDDSSGEATTNFVSERAPSWYAKLYQKDNLVGGHVIKLGPGNDEAAREALSAWPGGLQIGGGINADNAKDWLNAGASHVIVTSWVFRDGRLDRERLKQLVDSIGKESLILDLSCRKRAGRYFVCTDRWQKFTELEVTPNTLLDLSASCAEFLVHAVDVEGLCQGVDLELVRLLAESSPIPATYAGGARSMEDLVAVTAEGRGKVDLTIGSALDIFGGDGIRYEDAAAFNRLSH